MRVYNTLIEAKKELKEKTGAANVRYFLNNKECSPSEYRSANGEALIYRSGMEIHAVKTAI